MDDDPEDVPVKRTYDRIAEHFASTRAYPWPEVAAFVLGSDSVPDSSPDSGFETAGNQSDRGSDAVEELSAAAATALAGGAAPGLQRAAGRDPPDPGVVGLDIGCGNGRHAEVLAAVAETVVGVDVSRELLRTARDRARDRGLTAAQRLVQADAASLPLRAGRVDVAVYVATLHHLRTRERRVRSLSEVARVLAPGGRALVSAWSTAHDRFDATAGFDTTVPWTLPGGDTVPRFYHIYDPAEFEAELRDSDLRTIATTVSSGNCYAVVAADR